MYNCPDNSHTFHCALAILTLCSTIQHLHHHMFYMYILIFSVEEERVSASSIANDKTSASRATGWKVHHLDPQLGDVVSYRQVNAPATLH